MSAPRTGPVMRDHTVAERSSTPLELLFDLCFVVAVAFLAAGLDHGIVDGHPWKATATYALLFIPIWWAWMSYTWFATAFSHDDAINRILTFLQMAGILAVAAAIPRAEDGELLPFAVSYALMRVPLIAQWVRSAIADPEYRRFALTYAAGSAMAQMAWVLGAAVPRSIGIVIFVGALAVELATPMLAVRQAPGRVLHAGHIAERYGLFTIIVLGEMVLAGAKGLEEVIKSGDLTGEVLVLVAAGLSIAFAMWWLYFSTLGTAALDRNRRAAFVWGYGHYGLFAALAAVGAGVTAEIHATAETTGHGATVAAAAVAIALLTLAVMRRAAGGRDGLPLVAGAAALALLAGLVRDPQIVLLGTALLSAGVLAVFSRLSAVRSA